MSQRLLGAIGVLWGGGILLFGLLNGSGAKEELALAGGQRVGWIFGLLLFFSGIYYLAQSPDAAPK